MSNFLSTVVFNVNYITGELVCSRPLTNTGARTIKKCCKENNIRLLDTQISIMGINRILSYLNEKNNAALFSRNKNFNVPITFLC